MPIFTFRDFIFFIKKIEYLKPVFEVERILCILMKYEFFKYFETMLP
jgi:hypothetical protein